jgi:phosphomannomutase/phosphoglucomutase
MLNPHVFRAYDVRGLVGHDINPDVFRHVGRAYATMIRRNGGRRIAVGRDNRLSSNDLKVGFVEGVRAAGVDVVDIGPSTTPILYFATAHWKLDGGANITGSHNPIEYNGVKMVHPGAAPLSEDEIQGLRATIERGDFESGAGGLSERSPREDYFATIARIVRPGRRLKVVVDAGNGVAGLYGPEVLRRIGCDVVELHCDSDGSFPNHLPDPEDERNVEDLKLKVVEVGADVGIAYDGDADRVGVIDERGGRHEADLILILLARDLLSRHPGAKVVFDVKSSQALVDDIRQHGGVPIMWKTGHSHLKRKMRDDHILLGGEVSGHMFFAENYYGVDDGILASCKIIELAALSAEPLSRQFASIPHLRATPELKAPCADGEKFRVVEEVTRELKRRYETIDTDGARVIFPGRGWGLVRASNTNPYLTLRFEARTDREIEEMKQEIYGVLRRYPVTLPDEHPHR